MCKIKEYGLKEAIKDIKYFLLDMDGTVYLGSKVIGDMPKTLDFLREQGKKIIYLTNNSSLGIDSYVKKLTKMDLFKEGDEVYSSGIATAEYLNNKFKGKSVYLLGTNSLKEEFKKLQVPLTEDENAEIGVLAYDTELTYSKLCSFVRVIKRGGYYIATHPDATCPAEEIYVPDVGSFISLIEKSTGLTPVEIIGKPYTLMGENLKLKYGCDGNSFVMVGDRLHTDIAFGVNSNFHSLLVLSGETTESMLETSPIKPEFVLNDLNEIKKYF